MIIFLEAKLPSLGNIQVDEIVWVAKNKDTGESLGLIWGGKENEEEKYKAWSVAKKETKEYNGLGTAKAFIVKHTSLTL